MIITALNVSAISQPILAVGLILAGALQAIGDTKSPLYSTAIGMWGIRILGVYIFGIYIRYLFRNRDPWCMVIHCNRFSNTFHFPYMEISFEFQKTTTKNINTTHFSQTFSLYYLHCFNIKD